jgi:hypothetical protein
MFKLLREGALSASAEPRVEAAAAEVGVLEYFPTSVDLCGSERIFDCESLSGIEGLDVTAFYIVNWVKYISHF